jgi:putative intracellular protease/amidase
MKNILMIITSHARLGETGTPTGYWLEELAAPYGVFAEAGALIDLASPKGGKPPADPKSESSKAESVVKFNADPAAVVKLASTRRIDEITESYDAVFVVGGHGTMWDLPLEPALAKLLARTYESGGVVAAVCHGPAALVSVRLASGKALVDGKRVTAFTNDEEKAVELDGIVPFALETRLVELGARFEGGPMWKEHAVRDGRLVTGQNPASSAAVAREVLSALV